MLKNFIFTILFLTNFALANSQIEITDIANRKVLLTGKAQRIVFASSFHLLPFSFVNDMQKNNIVAIGSEIPKFDKPGFNSFIKANNNFTKIPQIGSGSIMELDLETIINAKPDLIIFALWQKDGNDEFLKIFDELKIPYVFVDFYQNPLQNIMKSMEIFSKITQEEEKYKQFNKIYTEKFNYIQEKLREIKHKPSVFLQGFLGAWECCYAAGNKGVGEYLEILQAQNIASEFAQKIGGNISKEFLLRQNPDVYIATGVVGTLNAVQLGMTADKEEAQRSFFKALQNENLDILKAVENKRAFAIWNYFSSSPLNIVALEALAKFLHPDIFSDLDYKQTQAEIMKFSSIDLSGTYIIELE